MKKYCKLLRWSGALIALISTLYIAFWPDATTYGYASLGWVSATMWVIVSIVERDRTLFLYNIHYTVFLGYTIIQAL